ncbi:RNA polymerase sigma factor [Membranihabitans maritimus]|uniref:RNA polymerase sigma factor n=1 Tax=Membranihabitans maritimus TaxID=2904244 RepID=UPI001F1C6E3B
MKNTVDLLNDEKVLVERCVQQDRKAQKRLYKRYARKMYNVAYRILRDDESAQDALQEGFLVVLRDISSFRGDSSLSTWIHRIIVYKSINILKREKNVSFEKVESEFSEPFEFTVDEYKISIDQIKEAIASLSDGYRTIINLYLIEGYDHTEISEILGVSESTSRSQYHRGRKALQQLLKNKFYGH